MSATSLATATYTIPQLCALHRLANQHHHAWAAGWLGFGWQDTPEGGGWGVLLTLDDLEMPLLALPLTREPAPGEAMPPMPVDLDAAAFATIAQRAGQQAIHQDEGLVYCIGPNPPSYHDGDTGEVRDRSAGGVEVRWVVAREGRVLIQVETAEEGGEIQALLEYEPSSAPAWKVTSTRITTAYHGRPTAYHDRHLEALLADVSALVSPYKAMRALAPLLADVRRDDDRRHTY